MINTVYRLVSPKKIEAKLVNEVLTDEFVVVRPIYLSICHADKRYYFGLRDKEVLDKKLPMSLIHESVGEVVFDPKNMLTKKQKVVMVPNTPFEESSVIAENYLPSSKFRSSGYDGFMQELVYVRRDRIVPISSEIDTKIAAIVELISVAMHAIKRTDRIKNSDKEVFGIWGDGNLGYIMAILLKEKYPESKIVVYGKHKSKLNYFSFVDEVCLINEIDRTQELSHCFECTGGNGSKFAIDQAIDLIKPEGVIAILGVSENPVDINTRMVLEKGLTIIGSSRSGYQDFLDTVNFLNDNIILQERLLNLISNIVEINEIKDIDKAFEIDHSNFFGKTLMKWNL